MLAAKPPFQVHFPLIIKILSVFGLAMLLRMTLFYYNNNITEYGKHLFDDSCGYYQVGVSLANGDGYCLAPGYPYYCREPGTSYFYAMGVSIYKTVTGRAVSVPVYDKNNWPLDRDNQNVIMLIRFLQATIQALAIVFFYLLLRHYLKDSFSFAVSLMVALYLPLAFYSEALLRENLLLFFLILSAFVFSSYLHRPAFLKLAVLGISWGLAALTLQVYLIYGVFLFAFFFLKDRVLSATLKRCAVISALFCVTVFPWLYKVYTFYPDIRIAQSMGCSLTFDFLRYCRQSEAVAGTEPTNTSEDAVSPESSTSQFAYYHDSKEVFQRTFNGFYRTRTREMAAKHGTLSFRKKAAKNIANYARFVLLPGYITGYGAKMELHDYRNSVLVLFVSFLIGMLSVVGLIACARKMVFLLPVYLFHLIFCWVMLSEARRALPVIPFFICLGVIGCLKVFQLAFPNLGFSIFRNR